MNLIKLKNISIKIKLIAYSVLMISLTALIISIALYKTSENIIREQVGEQTRITSRLIRVRTDELLKDIQNVALSLAYDKRLTMLMSNSEFHSYEYYDSINDISKYIGNYNYVNKSIGDLYVYNVKDKFYISAISTKVDINKDDPLYSEIIKSFANTSRENRFRYFAYFTWFGNMKADMLNEKKEIVSLIIPIRNNSYEILGALVFNIRENAIANIYNDAGLKSGYNFSIQNSEGIIISSSDKKIIGSKEYNFGEMENSTDSIFRMVNGVNSLLTVQKSSYNNWKYISIIPVSELMKDAVANLKKTILVIFLAGVAMLFVLSIFINNIFYKPVKYFINNIKSSLHSRKQFEKIPRDDEIGFIFNSFNDILKENNKLITDIYDHKIYVKSVELKMLESQINPHFLYNTLDGAICMIKIQEPDKAEKMLDALIKLYRMSLDNQIMIVSIREEMENLKCYIIIQDFRYYGKITFDFNVQEEILECRILKLVLQPLVENTINHGFGKERKSIHIAVKGIKRDEMVVLSVWDNGAGISSSNLQELQKIIGNTELNVGKFYALHNINRRIKLFYGEKYGLTIDSLENKWTEIKLTVPF